MGKTSKWIINLLTGKKEENKVRKQSKIIPATLVSREKRRWSFCRRRDSISAAAPERASAVVAGAAIKIQSVFRAHLARRALKALKGLVKLQALVRGQLVRKQATAALRFMESLMTAQTRARSNFAGKKRFESIKRLHMSHEDIIRSLLNQDCDIGPQKHIKIMEKNISNHKPEIKSINIKTQHSKISNHISPSSSSSVITTSDHMSLRTFSNHFERYSISPARLIGPFAYPGSKQEESSSFYNDQLYLNPNYMADTESSRAKLRSQSAPKQRPVETSRRTSSYVSN